MFELMTVEKNYEHPSVTLNIGFQKIEHFIKFKAELSTLTKL